MIMMEADLELRTRFLLFNSCPKHYQSLSSSTSLVSSTWSLFFPSSISVSIFIRSLSIIVIWTLCSSMILSQHVTIANEFNEVWKSQPTKMLQMLQQSTIIKNLQETETLPALSSLSPSMTLSQSPTELMATNDNNNNSSKKNEIITNSNINVESKYEPEIIDEYNGDNKNDSDNEDNILGENDSNEILDGSNDDEILKWPNSATRLKREVFRGQNYHYQRGYELSRLRYEHRLRSDPSAMKPKTFFIREYHQGRDVPKELLRLTQAEQLVQRPSTTSSPVITLSGGGVSDVDMKTMSDFQQKHYATKAALKAAIQRGDKDFSILDYLNKVKTNRKSSQLTQNGHLNQDHNRDEQIKDTGQKLSGSIDGNFGVRFDEQIKEDLNKILPYDPSKQFGERIRPFRPPWIPSLPSRPASVGGGSSVPEIFQPNVSHEVGGSTSGPVSGGSSPADDYLNKIRRLYPQLFPDHIGQGVSGGSGDSLAGGYVPTKTFGRDNENSGSGRPGEVDIKSRDGSGSGRNGSGSGSPGDSSVRSTNKASNLPYGSGDRVGVPYSSSGTLGAPYGTGGSTGVSGAGGIYGIRGGTGGDLTPFITPIGNRTSVYPLRPTLGTPASAYPSRFPGRLLSALTLYPGVKNSTFPGFPGYIGFDYPGYNTVPYTGFRCDLQNYKIGYYADVAAGCQVFHICQHDGRMDSFLCPNGTLFHQKVMTCDWWYLVNCPAAPSYYYLNGRIGVLPPLPATLSRFE